MSVFSEPPSSCKDRCDVITSGPCSCDVTCLVYRKCCADFEAVCPETVTSSRIRFPALTGDSVTCQDDGVMVVSRCQGHDLDDVTGMTSLTLARYNTADLNLKDPGDVNCWEKTLTHHTALQSLAATTRSEEEDLHQATNEDDDKTVVMTELSTLRVSDRSTGLVYANLSVFSCHALNTSVPCLWHLRMRTTRDNQLPFLENAKGRLYQEPPNEDVIPPNSVVRCQPRSAIEICSEESAYFSKELMMKCHRVDVSESRMVVAGMVYKNKFCVECMHGKVDISWNVAFSSLLTLSAQGLIVQNSKDINTPTSFWETAMCDLDEEFVCRVSQCTAGYFRRPDGVCKENVFLHFGLRVKGQGRVLSYAEHKSVSDLMRCVVSKHLTLDVDDPVQFQLTRYSLSENIHLFGFKIQCYFSNFFSIKSIVTADILAFSRRFGNVFYGIFTPEQPNELMDMPNHLRKKVEHHDVVFTYTKHFEGRELTEGQNRQTYDHYVRVSEVKRSRFPIFCSAVSPAKNSFFRHQPLLVCIYPPRHPRKGNIRDMGEVQDMCKEAFLRSTGRGYNDSDTGEVLFNGSRSTSGSDGHIDAFPHIVASVIYTISSLIT